ncbi:oligogalacturonate lyase family protein [Sphingomonas sp. BIUV-7]|uniref:Oligogalacturonate lyase family protein n=1 Tax=Sphingomonas natans TaxID=3063330 RepID=A0ABT8YD75_9SPHN|nr:oligogalacturonate lyase family protein [Sphingomonas sp. BIUV-7]MDO6416330.1 oligogalacturonate lyase family protein [Sphingomonas sp. BIUV-7]
MFGRMILLGLATGALALGPTSGLGAQPAPRAMIDATTGHRIINVDDRPGVYALYFNYNAFTPDGTRMVYLTPEGIRTAHVGDWTTKLVLKAKVDRLLFTGHTAATAYYTTRPAGAADDGGPYTVWVLDLDSGKTRKIAEMDGGRIESINADDTLLAGNRELAPPPPAIAAQGRRDPKTGSPNYTGTDAQGRPLSFAAAKDKWMGERLAAHVPMEIFTLDAKTGERRSIHKATDWLNHVQFSPVDPGLLMFCHEGPWHKVDRIWTIRADGSALTKIHARTMQGEIAGHEYWAPDGKAIWYDLQAPKGGMLWLARTDITSGARTWYKVAPDQGSYHYMTSPDGKLVAGDGNNAGKYISLFRPIADPSPEAAETLDGEHLIATGSLASERIVDMAKQDYTLEPNEHFTPDGKWLVYRANVTGAPALYAAEVAKAR